MSGFAGADRSFFYGGGAPPFSEREINVDFEGGALLNKAYADVVKSNETLDAHITKGMPYGRNQSEANKPTLDSPLTSLRIRTGGKEGKEEEFNNTLKQLTNLLPKDMKEQLAKELKRPESQRNPAYSALGKSLAFTAKALLLLNQASKSFQNEKTTMRFAKQNLEFTGQALQNLIKEGRELLKEGYANLKKLGPNNPHFDTLLKHLKNAANALKLLKRIADEEKKKQQHDHEDEEEEGNNKKNKSQNQEDEKEKSPLELALERVDLYSKHYDEAFTGDHLLMIGPLLHAISEMGRTQSLNDGLRSILFGLSFYHIGMDSPQSQTSPIGENTNRVITKLLNLVSVTCLSDIDPKARELFPLISKVFITLCVTGAIYLVTSHRHHEVLGESLIDDDDEYLTESEETLINTYVLWNLMLMFLRVDLIKKLLPEELFDPQYGITNSLSIVTQIIELTTICITIRAIRQYDEDASDLILSGLAPAMITRMVTLEDIVDRLKGNDSESIGMSADELKGLSIQLTNCRLALQSEQFNNWSQYWDELTTSLGDPSTDVEGEIDYLFDQAHLLKTLSTEDIEDFSNAVTGIVQI
jgi:hypothetical protein